MKNIYGMAILFLFSMQAVAGLSYKPGGGMKMTVGDSASLRLLGYVQTTYNFQANELKNGTENEFFVRRGRLDFIFDFKDKYQVFFEFDGRGTARTEMVLAQVDVRYADNHSVQVGKFITPFSPENFRSSRGLSTVERYSALNSMFLIPALDTQYGFMLHGNFESTGYFFSVTNGNGKASGNIVENNNAKDIQFRLQNKFSSTLQVGGSLNYSEERAQQLKLADHNFNSFNSAEVSGSRLGGLGFVEFIKKQWLIRGEGFYYNFFESLSASSQIKGFGGGYAELGYFINGNTINGLQLVSRYEHAQYFQPVSGFSGSKTLRTFLVGNNWYMDGVFRLQVNLIYERADHPSELSESRLFGKDDAFQISTMLQIKF